MYYLVCGMVLAVGVVGRILPDNTILIMVFSGLSMAGSTALFAFPALKGWLNEALAGGTAMVGIWVIVLSSPNLLEAMLTTVLVAAIAKSLLRRCRRQQSAQV